MQMHWWEFKGWDWAGEGVTSVFFSEKHFKLYTRIQEGLHHLVEMGAVLGCASTPECIIP